MYFIAIVRLSHKPSWTGCIPAGDIKIIDWLIDWLIGMYTVYLFCSAVIAYCYNLCSSAVKQAWASYCFYINNMYTTKC